MAAKSSRGWKGLTALAICGALTGLGVQAFYGDPRSAMLAQAKAERNPASPPQELQAAGHASKDGVGASGSAVAKPAPLPATEPATPARVVAQKTASSPAVEMTMEQFLDRLMVAESGGRDDAANPRSTAVGPFQFIERTWVDVMRRHFPDKANALAPAQLLALRTDRATARRAAEAFTRDNASYLQEQGLASTFPNLRLAFLVGPHGAARVLRSPMDARVAAILGPKVAAANPFMFGMTAQGLVERSARDIAASITTTDGVAPGAKPAVRRRPAIAVNCNMTLPSCRRWLVLAERKLGQGRPARQAAAKNR